MQDPSHLVALRCGRASAQFAPWIGGAIAGFRWDLEGRRFDWLRATSDDALSEGRAENVSCFPLVPFSNRVRDGRFSFAGREVRLPVDRQNPHALHGHGWRAPWTIEAVSADRLTLSYSHTADAWPWSYRAEQRFALTEAALSVELVLANCSGAPMPCGLGLHPYFPRDATTRLTAQVEAMWETDAEVLPTRRVRCASAADPSRGLPVDAIALDNAFTGWSGAAEIAWPERGARLRMEADAPLRVLVVFSPPARGFFCAEPVSNITDGFNRPGDDSGVMVLAPGQTVSTAMRFIPQFDVP